MNVANNIGRHSHPDPNGLIPTCPTSPSCRHYFSSPIIVIVASSFVHSFLHQIPFGTWFWSSSLSSLRAKLQESFYWLCFPLRYCLLRPRPGDLHSGRRCILVIRCASKKYLASTLLGGTFSSLHELFLCVHSILIFMTFQCSISKIKCPHCRSTKTQVNPSSALKRTKHHQSDQSNVLGILGSS